MMHFTVRCKKKKKLKEEIMLQRSKETQVGQHLCSTQSLIRISELWTRMWFSRTLSGINANNKWMLLFWCVSVGFKSFSCPDVGFWLDGTQLNYSYMRVGYKSKRTVLDKIPHCHNLTVCYSEVRWWDVVSFLCIIQACFSISHHITYIRAICTVLICDNSYHWTTSQQPPREQLLI